MKLFIAEKPQLAQVIAQAIGVVAKKDGYYECKGDVCVTNALGHVLAQKMPEQIDPKFKVWNLADLPLPVRPIPLTPTPRAEKQFKIIEGLLKKADTVVNAGDPDDEGQLLVDEILRYCKFKGKEERILINDLRVEAARKELSKIRPNSEFQGLSNKALARSQADYLFGLNLTRAYTLFAQKKGLKGVVLSVGRVQTPTLGMIVRRYLANQGHKESFYYNIFGGFGFDGRKIEAPLLITSNIPTDPNNEKSKRIIDESVAMEIKAKCTGKPAKVKSAGITAKSTAAPLPFALLDLQVKMSNKYNISSDDTLAITQALREKHKAITYNRSDCRYLSSDQFAEAPQTLAFLAKQFSEIDASKIDNKKKSKAFDDSKITAHTAIIPVPGSYSVSSFTDKEKKVFYEIVMQYVIQFMPEKKYDQASATIECEGYLFETRANKVTDPGWSNFASGDDKDDDEDEVDGVFDAIAALKGGSVGKCDAINIKKEKTKPLPLYTEATLLKDLQGVAKYVKDPHLKKLLIEKDKDKKGENGGIGTPATRSSIIKGLEEKGFFKYQSKKIVPTQTAIDFISQLPDVITYPDMTAMWFEQQCEIEEGKMTVDAFLDELEEFIKGQISNASNIKMEVKGEKCECGNGVYALKKTKSGGSFFGCTAYPNCTNTRPVLDDKPLPKCPCCGKALGGNNALIECKSCGLKVWRKVSNKPLTDAQTYALLTKLKTPLLKGLTSRDGKSFEAYAVLDVKNKQVKLEFPAKK